MRGSGSPPPIKSGIFYSYSHSDANFVDRLCQALIDERIHIWLDRWELNVGDSIASKIQSALTEASHLCVVLSKASVASDWCKRELTAGLFREIDEKRVVVLPILVEDCEIPLFLRDKVYADFRKEFDIGLRAICVSLAKVSQDKLGRINRGDYLTDFGLDWGSRLGKFEAHIDFVSFKKGEAWSILSTIILLGDPKLSDRFLLAVSNGKDREFINRVLRDVILNNRIKDLRIRLQGDRPDENLSNITIKGIGKINVVIRCNRIGEDSGRDILFDLGATLQDILSG